MKRILVPLDGSRLAEQVIPYVQALAPLLHAEVVLLQALDDGGQDPFLVEDLVAVDVINGGRDIVSRRATVPASYQEHSQSYLASQAALLKQAGISVSTAIRVGAPAEVIVEMADDGETLIAMATHGYSAVRRWALGSVADKVVHAASGPVFLARGDAPTEPPSFQRILVPLDGSPLAQQALPCATELARCAGAELILLRAIEPLIDRYAELQPFGYTQPPDEGWILEQRAQIKRDLATRAEAVRRHYPHTRAMVDDGYPAEIIVDEASRLGADLIIMATHGRSGVQRWALGSVADKVLHSTQKPLVLIRARER